MKRKIIFIFLILSVTGFLYGTNIPENEAQNFYDAAQKKVLKNLFFMAPVGRKHSQYRKVREPGACSADRKDMKQQTSAVKNISRIFVKKSLPAGTENAGRAEIPEDGSEYRKTAQSIG